MPLPPQSHVPMWGSVINPQHYWEVRSLEGDSWSWSWDLIPLPLSLLPGHQGTSCSPHDSPKHEVLSAHRLGDKNNDHRLSNQNQSLSSKLIISSIFRAIGWAMGPLRMGGGWNVLTHTCTRMWKPDINFGYHSSSLGHLTFNMYVSESMWVKDLCVWILTEAVIGDRTLGAKVTGGS